MAEHDYNGDFVHVGSSNYIIACQQFFGTHVSYNVQYNSIQCNTIHNKIK